MPRTLAGINRERQKRKDVHKLINNLGPFQFGRPDKPLFHHFWGNWQSRVWR